MAHRPSCSGFPQTFYTEAGRGPAPRRSRFRAPRSSHASLWAGGPRHQTFQSEDPEPRLCGAWRNGELRQNSNTRHLVFDLWDQIAHLSQAMTLEPGDMIFTGTPGGIGFGSKPYRPLKAGDVLRCEVDGLGAIENRVVPET
ncbi:fumarylacetoacetate hydrolase family protein [Ruegeria marina]|nr:fumarylacetoacetate hydrolase family protein [Ruegeria marina]